MRAIWRKNFRRLACISVLSPILSGAQTAALGPAERDHLAAAQQAEQAKNYAEAGTHYQAILEKHPDLALIHQSLAVTYHLRNLYPQAISEFQRALHLDPSLWGSHLFLGMDYYKSNQFKQAIPELQKSIQLNAAMAEPEARFWLAVSDAALDRHEDAIRELRRALELRPKDVDVLYYLTKEYDQAAAAAFERLGQLEPHSAAVAILQAERFSEENRADLARVHFRNARFLRPDFSPWIPEAANNDPPADLQMAATDAKANLNLARLFAAAGDQERARSVVQNLKRAKGVDEKAAQILSQADAALAPPRRPNTELAQGLDLFRAGKFQEAQAPLARVAAADPNPALRLLLVRSYLEGQQYVRAEEILRKMLASDPANIDALHLLGRSYKRQAEATLKYITEIDHDSYGVHELLGQQHEEHTEYQQAIDEYQAALAKRPDLAGLRYAIGNVYRKMSRFDQAEHWLNEELARNPFHGLAHFRLGSIFLEQGKAVEAADHLQQALRSHPQLTEARMDLGRAYTTMGRYPQAVRLLQEVAAAEPNNDRVHYLLSSAYAKQGERVQAQKELAEYQRLTRTRLQNTQQDVKAAAESVNQP